MTDTTHPDCARITRRQAFGAAGALGAGSTGTTTAVGARLASVRFRHTATGRRIMHLRIALTEPAGVRIRLTRSGHHLLTRRVRELATGAHTVDVRLPDAIARGKATLSLTFTDSDGHSKTTTAGVAIPERQR